MGAVAIVLAMSAGQFVVAIFLIDTLCLGVKNVIATFRSRSELTKLLEGMQGHDTFETVTLGVARSHVEAAIVYAAALGFKRHDD